VVFLAAVSGGADSIAMLASLCSLKKSGNFGLFCITVDHGLRPPEESRGDADFVAAFCKELGVDCTVAVIPPGKIAEYAKKRRLSLEAAARFFRRRAFFREAARLGDGEGRGVVILTGHTKDDLLETALMRVLQGAGPCGLAAMPARRGSFARPLINLGRAQVLAYLGEKKIPWREDLTNRDGVFLRNRIRGSLIPMLDNAFPFWRGGLEAMAGTQALAAGFIKSEAASRVTWERRHSPFRLSVKAERFFAQPAVLQEEALFGGLNLLVKGLKGGKARGAFSPKRSVLRGFCQEAAESPKLSATASLGRFGNRQIMLEYKKGRVFLLAKAPYSLESGFSLLIKTPCLCTIKGVDVKVSPLSERETEFAGAFRAALPLVLRSGFSDDFIVSGGRKVKFSAGKAFIVAEDSRGPAAFIGKRGFLLASDAPFMEEPPSKRGQIDWGVRVSVRTPKHSNGGIDV